MSGVHQVPMICDRQTLPSRLKTTLGMRADERSERSTSTVLRLNANRRRRCWAMRAGPRNRRFVAGRAHELTGRMRWLVCKSGGAVVALLLAAFSQFLCGNASGFEVPTTPWQIAQIRSRTGIRSCSATAIFTTFPSPMIFERYIFFIGPDGKGTLHDILAEPATLFVNSVSSSAAPFRPEFHRRRGWFDDEPAFTIRESISPESVGIVHGEDWDLRAAGGLVERFARNTRFTFETADSKVVFQNGEPVRMPARTETIFLAGNSEVFAALKACVEAARENRSFVQIDVPAAAPPVQRPPTLREKLAQLAQAEKTVDIARKTSESKEVLGLALSRLGNLQADALRLGEAKVSLGAAISALQGVDGRAAELRRTEDRLIEVLLNLEQLDEAEQLAQKLPDPRRWIAAIAIRRGDYDAGSHIFLSLIGEDIGASLHNNFNILKDLARERDPALSPDRTRRVRDALLAWGSDALGQEDMTPDLEKPMYPIFGAGVPSFALAEAVFDWIDPAMLRRGVAQPAIDHAELGRAAFLRGEGLRRAGFLEAVETDLRYALSELKETDGEDGWQYRARLALVALTADRGQDLGALSGATELLSEIEAQLTDRSLVWAEATSLVSALQLRNGDIAGARATAENAASIAARSLSPDHSLTMQLHLRAAEALLAAGDGVGAAHAAARAIGLADLPHPSDEELKALWQKLRETRDINKRVAVIRAALGLPSPVHDRPVLQRKERIHAAHILMKASSMIHAAPEQQEAGTLALALHMEETQLLYNASAQDKSFAFEQSFGFKGALRNYPENPYRRAMAARPAGVWALAEILKLDAEKLIAPNALVPSDMRLTIPPGRDLDALELLLRDLRTLPGQPVQKNDRISLALAYAQAAASRDVMAILATRAVAYSERGIDRPLLAAGPVNMAAAAETAAADVFQRRLRGWVQDLTAGNSNDSAELRRRYFELIGSGTQARALAYNAFGTRFAGAGTYMESLVYEASAEGFRKRLGPHEAVVVWLPLEHTTQAFVIRKDATNWLEIPEGRVALAKRVSRIRTKIDRAKDSIDSGVVPPLSEYPADDAYALYSLLFSQMDERNYLAGIDHIYTAQLGVTGGLPLDLLVVKPPQPGRPLAWLGERWAVTRMPTLINPAVLDRRPPLPRSAPRLLAIGAPKSEPSSCARHIPEPLASAVDIHCLPGLPALPNAEREMREVADSLHVRDLQDAIVSGAAATYSTVLKRLRDSHQAVLMFSTHGLVRDGVLGVDEPMLVLTPPARPTLLDDEFLRASDIVGLDINADLVILSACSTAPSGEDGAEPLAGLAAAFMAAGAKTVMASHWAVESGSAEQLTTAVVSEMFGRGRDAAEALKDATYRVRNDDTHAHPVFWAPFEVIGFPAAPTAQGQVSQAAQPNPRSRFPNLRHRHLYRHRL